MCHGKTVTMTTRFLLRDDILAVVSAHQGNITRIASAMHVDVRTVFRWSNEFEFLREAIDKARFTAVARPAFEPIVVESNYSRGVYAIKAGDFVKIGKTENVNDRLKQIQTGSPIQLEFLGMLSPNPADESSFHNRFKHLHVRGEWFQSDPEILQAIQPRKK